MNVPNQCAPLVERVRERRPLVHHLTNYVTVNDCANVTLAIGGSPIMATSVEESGDIAALASAVVLNIGTLDGAMVESMIAAGKSANARGVPVVFDPVGAGASALRNRATERILAEVKVAVVRGNISEVRAAAGLSSHTKGVDAGGGDLDADAGRIALDFAREAGCVAAITGVRDAVSDGRSLVYVENGNADLALVSGTGCMCSSLVGAFVGAEPSSPLLGAAAAILCMGIAGDIAREKAGGAGLGSFRLALMDAVSLMDGETLARRGNAHEAAC